VTVTVTVTVTDFLLEPLRSGIGRRALLEVCLLGAICGALGFWVASFRLTYSAESLAHGMLPGLVVAALAGFSLLGGAAGGILVAAVLVALTANDERVGTDTGTAVVVTGLLGLGGFLALSAETPPRLGDLLFGDPLAVSDGDLIAAGALAVAGGAALLALHRPLTAVAFDPAAARALGLRPVAVTAALLALLAAALVVAVQGLGNLLVLAVLVAPPVAVRRHVSSPARAMAAGAVVAVAAGVIGIYVSQHLDLAAGAAVALSLCAAAALGALLPVRRAARRPARATA
jgi:ABC-type Mn2+/Zn2+ transport system permease subunit